MVRLRPELIQKQGKSCPGFRELLLNDRCGGILVGLFQMLVEFEHSSRNAIVVCA